MTRNGHRRGLLARFEQRPGLHRPRTRRNGAIFLAILLSCLYAGYTKSIPLLGGGGHEVRAVFARADHVRAGTVVRVRGVDVGEVESVQHARGRGVVVTMRIDGSNDVDLRSDARAAIWWRTLLGSNMYVEVDPGSPSAPRASGETIPLARTSTQQELDEVLQPLDRTARDGLRDTIGAFDEGFSERRAVGASVRALAPAMHAVAPALTALRGQRPGDLERLVRGASTSVHALSESQTDLAGLIDSGELALAVTAAREADLGRILEVVPGAEADIRATMARLRTTLAALDPVTARLTTGVRSLAPAARALNPALDQLLPLLRDAEPTLRDLRPALVRLNGAARAGLPLIERLGPTLARSSQHLLPWLQQRDPDTGLRNYQAIGPFFSATGGAAADYDANGHVLNFQTAPDERSLHAACQTYFTDPSASQRIDCSNFAPTLSSLFRGRRAR